jgi:hypothetical protein
MFTLILSAFLGQISYAQMTKGDIAVVDDLTTVRGWSDPSLVGQADPDTVVSLLSYGDVLDKIAYKGGYYYVLSAKKGSITIHAGFLRRIDDMALCKKIYAELKTAEGKLAKPKTKTDRKLYAKRMAAIQRDVALHYNTSLNQVDMIGSIGNVNHW